MYVFSVLPSYSGESHLNLDQFHVKVEISEEMTYSSQQPSEYYKACNPSNESYDTLLRNDSEEEVMMVQSDNGCESECKYNPSVSESVTVQRDDSESSVNSDVTHTDDQQIVSDDSERRESSTLNDGELTLV